MPSLSRRLDATDVVLSLLPRLEKDGDGIEELLVSGWNDLTLERALTEFDGRCVERLESCGTEGLGRAEEDDWVKGAT